MKSKLVIAGIVFLAVVMLAPLSSVMATYQTPPLTVSTQNYVWTVDLKPSMSGKNVTNVVVQWFYMIDNPNPPFDPPRIPVYNDLAYYKISCADSQIKIWIDTTQNFPETAENSYVIVTFTDGTTFVASGPGWAYGVH